MLKWNILLLLLMIVFSLGVYSAVGKQAPDFALTDINGNEFFLSDYRGRVVLMDLFRMKPSCPPCIWAIPHFKGVYNKYSRDDLVIMSISVSDLDTDESLRSDFVEEHNIPWIVACGGTQIASQYSVSAVPTLIIVDAEGDVRFRHEGVTDESKLISEIDSLFVPILSPENKKYATSSVPLNFTTSKVASWIRYSLDDAGNKTIKENITLTGLADGAHKVVVYFQDASGTTYSNEVHFTIDTAPTEDGDSDGGPWMSPQLIGITVVAVVFLLIVGIVVAGRVLQWSKPAKKRRVSK